MNTNNKIFITRLLQHRSLSFVLLVIVLATFLVSGCESLPQGNPPDGPIVIITPTGSTPLSPKDAVNYMTTALATCPLLYSSKDTPSINLFPCKISDSEKAYELQLNLLTIKLYRNLFEMEIAALPDKYNKNQQQFLLSSSFKGKYDILEEENDLPRLFEWKVKLLAEENTSKPLWEESVEVNLEKSSSNKST